MCLKSKDFTFYLARGEKAILFSPITKFKADISKYRLVGEKWDKVISPKYYATLELSEMKDQGQAWLCTPVIPALRRLRQEDFKFQLSSLGYIARPCPQNKTSKQKE
jgi:hypothetical protein